MIMRTLQEHIRESLRVNRNYKNTLNIKYKPKTRKELRELVVERINNDETNFSDVDVSDIDDLSYIFYATYGNDAQYLQNIIEIDITGWNTSRCRTFTGMFHSCKSLRTIIGIEDLDVSNGTEFIDMFVGCRNFNGDLYRWDMSNAENCKSMFQECNKFNSDISNWDLSNVTNVRFMLQNCKNLNCDITKWDIDPDVDSTNMLVGTNYRFHKNNKIIKNK